MIEILSRLAGMFMLVVLAGCVIVPNDGPLVAQIQSGTTSDPDLVYGLVKLNTDSITSLERHSYFPLSRKFGIRQAAVGNRIGVGDVLNITIFEAGPDGIFSTSESKNVNLDLVVQPNGRVSIPFSSTVQAAGRTPEQVRRSIIGRLRGSAVEPDVIVNVKEIRSRTVVVNGAVRSAQNIPLPSGKEKVLGVVSAAGGPAHSANDTYVSLTRRGVTRTTLLQNLIDHPVENIFVHPGDALFLSHDPRVFLAFGAVSKAGRHPFESSKVDLLDATAIAGGISELRANPAGYFVFRYEHEHVVRHLYEKFQLDNKTLSSLLENKSARDKLGRLPIVYRIDLSEANNFFLAKRFPVRSGDAIYVARSASVDFARILTLMARATSTSRSVVNF